MASRAGAGDLQTPVRALLRRFRVDLVAKFASNQEKMRATTTDVARLGGARVNARWFREFMAYDPSPDLARLKVPVLAVAGGKDLQAPRHDGCGWPVPSCRPPRPAATQDENGSQKERRKLSGQRSPNLPSSANPDGNRASSA